MLFCNVNKYNFIYLNIGFIILSFTVVNFLLPSNLTAGGTTGIAIILFHLYNIPISLGFFILNFPLVVISSCIFGSKYGIRTIYGILAITIYTEIISRWITIKYLKDFFQINPWLGAVLGGFLSGVGIGIVILMKGNTGGTTIFAQIIEKYFKIKVGTTLNITDISIVSLSGVLLGGSSAIFTIISLFICGIIINTIKYNIRWSYERNS